MSRKKRVSFLRGISFIFEDEGKIIEAWCSSISGLEKVYVDSELVSSHRTLSANSANVFSVGGNEYSVNFDTGSLLKGPYLCTLKKNGKAIRRQRLAFSGTFERKRSFWLIPLFFVFLGGLLGFGESVLGLPEQLVIATILLVLFLAFIHEVRTMEGAALITEEEVID